VVWRSTEMLVGSAISAPVLLVCSCTDMLATRAIMTPFASRPALPAVPTGAGLPAARTAWW
jgi:hypothetical protein